MKSIISWLGGKSKLAKQIIEMMPEHKCYCEVFAGAGHVYFRKEPSKVEVINDINKELVTLFRVIKHHPEEFLKQFKHMLVSRVEFQDAKQTPPETLTDIQRAARFFYLQKKLLRRQSKRSDIWI